MQIWYFWNETEIFLTKNNIFLVKQKERREVEFIEKKTV